jgi:hypothetical protein
MDAGAGEPDEVDADLDPLEDDDIPDDLLELEDFDDGSGDQVGPDEDDE